LRGLAKTLSLPRVPMSYRYGKGIVQLKGPVIYYQYTFTNIVPNSEPIESNSSFLWSFLWFMGEFSEYHIIYFKDVTSLFYYFRFN